MKKLFKKFFCLILIFLMSVCALSGKLVLAANSEELLSGISDAEPAVSNALAPTVINKGELFIFATVIGLVIAGVLVAVVVHKKKKSYTEATEEK